LRSGTGLIVAGENNDYYWANGTSIATPFVSGTIALMLSVNPNLTPAQIENIIKATADPIADASSFPGQLGAGRLNAYAAVRASCSTLVINFINQPPVTANKTIENSCGDITIQNVTITNGATLILKAGGDINVENVTVTNNAKLILEAVGEVIFTGDLNMDIGTELEIK